MGFYRCGDAEALIFKRVKFERFKTDLLGDFTEIQPEKLRVRGNPRKGIISVRTGFYASRDAECCVPETTGLLC